jgi:quinol-cytochrome oxidoreductase complex cytochrome b subunit
VKKLLNYFTVLTVNFHEINSLWGFFTLIVVFSQLASGIMLAFSLIPDSMLIPMSRDEEDCEDLVIDDFFWLHERGVDLIFVFAYIHLFRKIYLNIIEYEHEVTWKSGVFTFLIFQVVVFFGLILCCSHLSEITLTIAANIMHTFFFFFGKVYWWLFTDKQLNCDTLLRLAYGHYLAAFFMAYLGLLHGIDMHFDWKNEAAFDGLNTEMVWWDEALSNELNSTILVLFTISVICVYLYPYPEALSYEIFMWGDVGFINDIRFYGVAPHWYFRPLMAWLLVCPFHKLGIAGLVFFFFVLFYQPNLHNDSENLNYSKKVLVNTSYISKKTGFCAEELLVEVNLAYQITYGFFFFCALYTFTFLPYGRFYNRLGGNIGMLGAYFYVFFYLAFSSFRKSIIIELLFSSILIRSKFLIK